MFTVIALKNTKPQGRDGTIFNRSHCHMDGIFFTAEEAYAALDRLLNELKQKTETIEAPSIDNDYFYVASYGSSTSMLKVVELPNGGKSRADVFDFFE